MGGFPGRLGRAGTGEDSGDTMEQGLETRPFALHVAGLSSVSGISSGPPAFQE